MRLYRVSFSENGANTQVQMRAEDSKQAMTLFSTHKPNAKLLKLEEGPVINDNPFETNRPPEVQKRPDSLQSLMERPGIQPGDPENERLDRIAKEVAARSVQLIDQSRIETPKVEALDDGFLNQIFRKEVLAESSQPKVTQVPTQPIMDTVSAPAPAVPPAPVERYKKYPNGLRLDMTTMKLQKEEWVVLDDSNYRVIDSAGTLMTDIFIQVKKWIDIDE